MISLFLNRQYSICVASMDFCKKPKRLLELESCSLGQNEEHSQNEIGRLEAKQQRGESLENSADDFEEFVALMERIQYMKNQHLNFGIWEKMVRGEDVGVKVIKTKRPCLPSFEWEDFRVVNDTMSAGQDVCTVSAKDNPSSYEQKGKQSIQPAQYLKTGSSSAESFDLNVEPSSNV